jgi:hypothetical protein
MLIHLCSYVRSLEEKVRLLEKKPGDGDAQLISPNDDANAFNNPVMDTLLAQSPTLNLNQGCAISQATDFTANVTNTTELQQQARSPPSFAEELKSLSLEATAERHLGSTSGLPFARLTQMILRRLSPDKADFVFVSDQDAATTATHTTFFDLDTPSDLFDASLFQSLSESISTHPILFGDLFLADITQQDPTLVELAWPADEVHVQHLVDFYFAHSHTLYPILSKPQVLQSLERVKKQPGGLDAQPASDVFRLWMVLAIGSTTFSSVSLAEEAESLVYYNKALQYSEKALEGGEMVSRTQHW